MFSLFSDDKIDPIDELMLEYRLNQLLIQIYFKEKKFDEMVKMIENCRQILNENANFQGKFDTKLLDKWSVLAEAERSHNQVKQLHVMEKFKELSALISNLVANGIQSETFSLTKQLEIQLESLWHQKRFSECLKWSEIMLWESIIKCKGDKLKITSTSKQSVAFALSYLNELLPVLDCASVLSEHINRLIQSLIYLIDFQLTTENKKAVFNVTSLFECFTTSVEKSWNFEENVYSFLLIMFREIHGFLADKSQCNRNASAFLLFVFDFICNLWQKNAIDSNDVLHEFCYEKCLKQVTKCLFNYPEQNVIFKHHKCKMWKKLTWPRATQLLEVYRKDLLEQKPIEMSFQEKRVVFEIIDSIDNSLSAIIQSEVVKLKENIENDKMFSGEGDLDSLTSQVKEIFFIAGSILMERKFSEADVDQMIQYFMTDLALNPLRKESWINLCELKMVQFESMIQQFDANGYANALDILTFIFL